MERSQLDGHTLSRKERLHRVIFEADTTSGKLFDVALLLVILISIVIVSLESVESINQRHEDLLRGLEWAITVMFTVEYLLRLYCTKHSKKYATSFYGVIDLVAILPTYLSLFIPGAQGLLVIRSLRLLRVFRVFKLNRYMGEAQTLGYAIRRSQRRIVIFLFSVMVLGFISGAFMYLIEGPERGFTSIPQSVYWAITTITGTGYGDAVPTSAMGKALAVMIMVLGYSLIIVPTGILSSELMNTKQVSTRACQTCSKEGHDLDAVHCKHCGATLSLIE